MFADLNVYITADNNNANMIAQIMNLFCVISGQASNWNKPVILFSKHTDEKIKTYIKIILEGPDMNFNTLYCGDPLIFLGRKRVVAYNFIIDNFKAKLKCR